MLDIHLVQIDNIIPDACRIVLDMMIWKLFSQMQMGWESVRYVND